MIRYTVKRLPVGFLVAAALSLLGAIAVLALGEPDWTALYANVEGTAPAKLLASMCMLLGRRSDIALVGALWRLRGGRRSSLPVTLAFAASVATIAVQFAIWFAQYASMRHGDGLHSPSDTYLFLRKLELVFEVAWPCGLVAAAAVAHGRWRVVCVVLAALFAVVTVAAVAGVWTADPFDHLTEAQKLLSMLRAVLMVGVAVTWEPLPRLGDEVSRGARNTGIGFAAFGAVVVLGLVGARGLQRVLSWEELTVYSDFAKNAALYAVQGWILYSAATISDGGGRRVAVLVLVLLGMFFLEAESWRGLSKPMHWLAMMSWGWFVAAAIAVVLPRPHVVLLAAAVAVVGSLTALVFGDASLDGELAHALVPAVAMAAPMLGFAGVLWHVATLVQPDKVRALDDVFG